jgi:hypothetical protein
MDDYRPLLIMHHDDAVKKEGRKRERDKVLVDG